MYMNTGYLNQSHQDFKDKRQPLVVGSCGCYRLSTYPKLPTYRPRGRLDYQIIYIASLMTRNSLINGRRLFHQYFPPALKIT